jgi:hypothetical protein
MFGPEQAYLNSVRHDLQTRAARELDAYRQLEDAALNLAPVRLPFATPARTPSRTPGNGGRRLWRVRVAGLLGLAPEAPPRDLDRSESFPGRPPRGGDRGGLVARRAPVDLGAGPRQPQKY